MKAIAIAAAFVGLLGFSGWNVLAQERAAQPKSESEPRAEVADDSEFDTPEDGEAVDPDALRKSVRESLRGVEALGPMIGLAVSGAMKETDAAMREAERAMQSVDWDANDAEIDRAMNEVDWDKIDAEIDRAMAEIDWEQIETDIDEAMEAHGEEMEQLGAMMEKFFENFGERMEKMGERFDEMGETFEDSFADPDENAPVE